MNRLLSLMLVSSLALLSPLSIYAKDADAQMQALLSAPDRHANDRNRDKKSHPEVVLRMLNIGPGSVVLDVFGGGGYYSELSARMVGENGKVYLHNNKAYLNYVKKALDQRMQRINMPQLVPHLYEVDDMQFPENQADAAMIIMSFHDIFYDNSNNGWPQIDRQKFLGQIHKSLKSKGRFVIVDHDARPGKGATEAKSLHRLEKSVATTEIEAQGFKLVDESNILSNSADDMSKSVFDKEVRGKTNRYILAFEKR